MGGGGTRHHLIGLGTFGTRAARSLAGRGTLFLVDPEPGRAAALAEELVGARVEEVAADGVAWVADLLPQGDRREEVIVPTLPLHLAARVLLELPGCRRGTWPAPPPFPGRRPGAQGDYYSTLAPGLCPADCPGPDGPGGCRHGDRRGPGTLSRRLAATGLPGLRHLVIESRQLAPGTGGFLLGDLQDAAERIRSADRERFIVTTASACHAVSTVVVKGGGGLSAD